MRAVAEVERVGFIELYEIIAQRYESLGPEKVETLFADAHTHTSEAGAIVNAQCVLEGLNLLPVNPVDL